MWQWLIVSMPFTIVSIIFSCPGKMDSIVFKTALGYNGALGFTGDAFMAEIRYCSIALQMEHSFYF